MLATVGWEGARQLFGLFLQTSPAFGLLTGTLAGVLASLFWIYTGLAIVLFGAEFAAVLNGDRATDAPMMLRAKKMRAGARNRNPLKSYFSENLSGL